MRSVPLASQLSGAGINSLQLQLPARSRQHTAERQRGQFRHVQGKSLCYGALPLKKRKKPQQISCKAAAGRVFASGSERVASREVGERCASDPSLPAFLNRRKKNPKKTLQAIFQLTNKHWPGLVVGFFSPHKGCLRHSSFCRLRFFPISS